MFVPANVMVFSGTGNHDLARDILAKFGELGSCRLQFSHLNMDTFPDGESDLRIPDWKDIRGKTVILFQSMPTSELADQFLALAWAIKHQYGASEIVAVVPFMLYRRQDHPENMDEIHRNLWLIQNMKANGVDKLILCDIHSGVTLANCEKVGIQAWNVDPTPAYRQHLQMRQDVAMRGGRKLFVYSPDRGSVGRAVTLAKELGVGVAVTLKKRLHSGEVMIDDEAKKIIEELRATHNVEIILADQTLAGQSVVMREDELSTGGTAHKTGRMLMNDLRVHEVFFCATHAVCAPGWKRKLIDRSPFAHIYLGDTIERPYAKATGGMVTPVSMAGVIAVTLFEVLSR
ncbi:MAG: ribose-phosphate pyrophosphokinase-like domain-containing protein [Patescibacteria group bacterium]|nr:ribose-phosphate pyrophosphokinase-like domain-containing protein [Patescibacteria group bacterium]